MKKIITLSILLWSGVSTAAYDNLGNASRPIADTVVVADKNTAATNSVTLQEKKEDGQSEVSVEISAEPTIKGKADYQKLSEWENFQEKKLGNLGMKIQQQIRQAMTDKRISEELQENIKQYRTALAEIGKSIANLTLDDSEIKALAMKKKDLYNFSGEGLLLTVEAMTSEQQSPESVPQFENRLAQLSSNINQLNIQIMEMEEALDRKYANR